MKIDRENIETPSKAGCEFLRESYNVIFTVARRAWGS